MYFTHLRLENWRNFKQVDVDLGRRVFIFGPNAAGKSNLLDVFRFLRDIAEEQGGLRRAAEEKRRGLKYLRSLHARNKSDVSIEVNVALTTDEPEWHYKLVLQNDTRGRVSVKSEEVRRGEDTLLRRPNKDDKSDPARLSQTHLEQVSANGNFRELAQFFASIQYTHIIPQLVRDPVRAEERVRDPFGADFLEQMARTPKKRQTSKLNRISMALKAALPQFEKFRLERDEVGKPHLEARYAHWRPQGSWQREDQFSDGTLRLLGLLWVMLDGEAPLLLEEPELSLHASIVREIPRMMTRLTRRSERQVLLSTHSEQLMADSGIDPGEVLLLDPTGEATRVSLASEDPEICAIAEQGQSIAEILVARTRPKDVQKLARAGS